MPGRSSSNSGSTGFISFSGIESALSSLKNFQNCINTGMDTASSVALDLVETQTEVSGEYSMDKAMVEFAMMDRELNHYVKAVQSTINHVKEERPENIPDLKLLVEKKFLALQNKNSDADFQNNEKFVQFKQQLKELKKQYRGSALLELPASPWGCFEQDHRRPSQQSVGELPREYKDFGLRTSLLSYQTSIEHFGGFA
ncbi:E3 SUMO-protein ligase NSE2 isoform X3 [Desmodus rotundus]|uniref:E3 SUMO-protein ligase NSE2 isoform X3 n=1 Tax=Desmodus rotundus TaxID=9430 RepID=UPI0023813B37|nr:E3 SUMO-protein ligase NSE2 isoform X3 [Desmodus rotundus]